MQDVYQTLNYLKNSATLGNTFVPCFYRIENEKDKMEFAKLLSKPGINVSDMILGQLQDLIKSNNPSKKFTDSELEKLVLKHVNGCNINDYGVWVYYPWSNRLVHILDEKEFIKVRTSRNHYKITPDEQNLLAQKKIGVVGLSVGQSVSVTLAMERICGELRLADFDALELTNLNRIRTGIHNLGLPKVYSVAREISEIDPFVKVICYPDGLTEQNMDEFFTKNGKLDLLVEESDGFDIKILCRHKARNLKVPVIMEASDRCMVDVERFDLEPNRAILHGLVDHLDVTDLKKLKTNEEKIPYMVDILGLETCSTRLKASMIEIEQSINTWPQLASAVTMGGGIAADVSRRILLNQFNESGRYYVDVEEIIGDKTNGKQNVATITKQIKEWDFEYLLKLIPEQNNSPQFTPEKDIIEKIVEAACLAPSGGNSQPWRWVYKQGNLFLFNAAPAGQTLLDYDSTASLIGIGTSLENLCTKSAEFGYSCKIKLFPNKENDALVAHTYFERTQIKQNNLILRASAIGKRLTNRTIAPRVTIKQEVLKDLENVATEVEGAEVAFITGADELDQAGNVLAELDKIRLLDTWGHHDFVTEMRWTDEENKAKRDGVDIKTVHLTNSELIGFKIARSKNVMQYVKDWDGGLAFKRLAKKSVEGAGALGVLYINGKSKKDYLMAGRVLEKIWLQATINNLAFQPMSAGLFLYARLYRGNGEGLDNATKNELAKLRPLFEKSFCLKPGFQEMFIFRLSECAIPETRSLRKPLKDLFYQSKGNAVKI